MSLGFFAWAGLMTNSRSGKNFLHVAINAKDTEAVLFLIQVRVDVNSRTKVILVLLRVNI